MRILLTGSTGFIGSHLARKLANGPHELYALIRESSDLAKIHDLRGHVRFVTCNFESKEELEKAAAAIRPELCFHLAWPVKPKEYLSNHLNLNMLSATLDLAWALAKTGCNKFIGTGTCFEYATDRRVLSESSPTVPNTLYGASKLATYTVLKQLGALHGMEVAWARLFYQYGPFEHPARLIPSIIASLLREEEVKLTEGKQVRDFLHVEDVASALWAVAQSSLRGPVNIGSGQPVTIRNIAQKIGKLLNQDELIKFGALPYSPDDPMFVCADNALLRRTTPWAPAYTLEAGLEATIHWWRDQGNVMATTQ